MALYAALKLMRNGNNNTGSGIIWNSTLTKNSGYKEDEIKEMSMDMVQFVKNIENSSLQTLFKKYQQTKYHEVASIN